MILYSMIKQHLFANLIILLQIGAVLTYIFSKKWPLAFYWLTGVVANVIVTYFLKR